MKIRYLLLTGAYCAFIFWLSHQPEPPQPDIEIPFADKAFHFVLFGGLAAVLSLGMQRSAHAGATRHLLVPVLFTVAYALTDEVHQLFIPLRNFDPWDLVADAAGAVVVHAALWRLLWKHPWPALPPKE